MSEPITPPKPKKMNKVEAAKAELDGLDVYGPLMKAATEGWESLTDDQVMLLKWYGLYAHNTKDGHFMLRAKVTQGVLTADQVDAFVEITERYGRGVIDCTTRQCVQVHWIRVENIPDVFARLEAVGLTSVGACGDITRNLVGNTLSGLAADEVADGLGTATLVHEHFLGDKRFSNLPRKFKISINGRPTGQGRGLINCLSLVGAIHEDGTRGFNFRVGGGLSTAPMFAKDIDIFAEQAEVPEIIEGVLTVFRDSDELRRKRGRARIKYLVEDLGPEGFREAVVAAIGRDPRRAAPTVEEAPYHDHIGVTPQADGEHSAVGFTVPVGRLTGAQLREFSRLTREYSSKNELRLTHQQNVLISWVPNDRVADLLKEPLATELPVEPSAFERNTQTCTGKEFCGLAKVHTKDRVRELVKKLDQRVDVELGGDFRFHFAGCNSSCAQHQIGDVGVEGTLKRVDGEMIEAMDIRIGGRVSGLNSETPKFNEVVLAKVPHYDLEDKLVKVFDVYRDNRQDGESFRAFSDRVNVDWWQEQLLTADELELLRNPPKRGPVKKAVPAA